VPVVPPATRCICRSKTQTGQDAHPFVFDAVTFKTGGSNIGQAKMITSLK